MAELYNRDNVLSTDNSSYFLCKKKRKWRALVLPVTQLLLEFFPLYGFILKLSYNMRGVVECWTPKSTEITPGRGMVKH
jgi:hypothetical protein